MKGWLRATAAAAQAPTSARAPAGDGTATAVARARLPWFVIAPFLLALLLTGTLAALSIELLSAVRAYVAGESQWSKAEKEAVSALTRYAGTHDPADFERFHAALALPLGDRTARLELDRPQPDLARVRQAFLAGGNHADDIDGMVRLYRLFGGVDFMARAITTWAAGDEAIAELDALGERMRQRIESGAASDGERRVWLQQLQALSDRLTLLERRFSATLGEASRAAGAWVLGALALISIVLMAAAAALSLRPLRRQQRTERALRISQERLHRALEASELALWDFDVDSGEVYLSESWARLMGLPAKVTRTSFASLAELVPDDQRPGLLDALTRALKEPDTPYRVEHQVHRPDGRLLWILSAGRVVARASDGRALRLLGTNRDITARKNAERAQHELEHQLMESQKMEAIGTLAGGIAHDFNNVLGGILGHAALARQELAPQHPARPPLEQVSKAAARARGLVQQILAYSRRQPQQLVHRQLCPLILDAVALLRSTLPAGVSLTVEPPKEPLYILADASQIQQVVVNLCTNAWHALQGQHGHIEIGAARLDVRPDSPHHPAGLAAGPHAHLWVRDDGCGMDAATRARIFEPFYTTKPPGTGTGLGLSVVHGIVAEHHGTLAVDSSPGSGSTFHVYFPLSSVGGHPRVDSDWGQLAAPDPGGSGLHVVYIDDDEVMSLLVERLAQRLGYRVTCYLDPVQAVSRIRADPQQVDIVVSDLNMPVWSGIEVAVELARIRPDLPVVISTGHVTNPLLEQLERINVRHVMRKENTLEELGSTLRRALAQRRALPA